MRARRFVEVFLLVRGSGTFPYDMLRFDSCCPATERDTNTMGRDGRRMVLLRRFSPEHASSGNDARWHSFGWDLVAWSINRGTLENHPDLKEV